MKNYKLVKLFGMPYKGISKIYNEYPQLRNLSYNEQKSFLKNRYLIFFNCFSDCMTQLGNEAIDIIYDMEILQKTWALENCIRFDENNWQSEILYKQLEFYKPDVLYFQDNYPLSHMIRRELKKKFKFIKLVTLFKGASYNFKEFVDVDILFLGTPLYYQQAKKEGIHSHLLYHSFDTSFLTMIESNPSLFKYEFSFIGTSGYGLSFSHYSRYWALYDLLNRTNITLFITENDSSKITLQNQKFPIKFVPMKPLFNLFPNRCQESVFGLAMYNIFANSKLTFNIHGDTAFGYCGNMRMFEATGVGTCLLTDSAKNMSELFEEDREVVTYSSIDECIEKLNYLLEHEKERQMIAEAGQKRCLRDHTLMQRCEEINDIIQKKLFS